MKELGKKNKMSNSGVQAYSTCVGIYCSSYCGTTCSTLSNDSVSRQLASVMLSNGSYDSLK